MKRGTRGEIPRHRPAMDARRGGAIVGAASPARAVQPPPPEDLTHLSAGCSPDPDDVFMFWALGRGMVEAPFSVEPHYEDIETLNRKALTGRHHITAISAYLYPFISHRYALLSAGASVGRGYGPIIVARRSYDIDDMPKLSLAIPGRFTTSYLLCRLFLRGFKEVEMDFEDILPAVLDRSVDCGLLIHEAQLTWRSMGLKKVVSLQDLWRKATGGLPIPLGLEAVRVDVARKWGGAVNDALVRSIQAGRAHLDEALHAAITHRDTRLTVEQGRRYLEMYVNDDTERLQEDSREALRRLYRMGKDQGLVPEVPELEIVE